MLRFLFPVPFRDPPTALSTLVAALLAPLLLVGGARAADFEPAAARIVGATMVEGRAWDKLAYLTDRIGHRLSGSEGLERAVEWSAAELRRDGLEHVWTEKVLVPHWVRGRERVRIVAPVELELAALALGDSVGTPAGGLRAEVVAVRSFEELEALGEQRVRGKIVLYNRPMRAGWGVEDGYGSVVRLRGGGASAAARLGSVGMLLRSLGTADFRLPHTGALRYADDAPRIPAAAISVEDAELVQRLLESGDAVTVQLDLGAKMLEDAESANVIAEIRGREKPDEIVLIGAHLDSWDVGQGAHDDGAGCAIVMEVLSLLHRLELTPRRTVRGVLFTNEENGLRGGTAYAERHGHELHVAAMESDSGGFRPLGFGITAGEGGLALLRRLSPPLAAVGADEVYPRGGGADISPLRKLGVPVLGLRVEGERYFDYHHTEADTLDKVDREDLNRSVAAMALMAYMLAEQEATLPRNPVKSD